MKTGQTNTPHPQLPLQLEASVKKYDEAANNTSASIARRSLVKLLFGLVAVAVLGRCLLPSTALAQQSLTVTTLVEKKVAELPGGELFWRIENYSSAPQAQAAVGPWSLVAESAGKVWLFTLGPAGESSAGGVRVAEVGPIPRVMAPQYLLRINEVSGPPGSVTPVHSHPGSEAIFVLSGEESIRTSGGVTLAKPGQPETGHGADMAMQASSSGSTDLRALVMFVVDATRPFSSPAKFP